MRIISILILIITCVLYTKEYKVSNISEFNTSVPLLIAGDTLTMQNGVWTNVNLVFRGTGTSALPIILRVATPGGVILSGTSTLKISGKYLVVDGLTFKNGQITSGSVIDFKESIESSYCRLTNTSIIDYSPTDQTKDTKWVSLYGERNRVDHCYFKGKKNLGTTLVVWLSAKPNYHLIDHNYFGLREELGVNGGETIRVGTSDWSMYDSYTTVEYNYFEECNGEIEIISNKSCENTYRYNTFYNCQGMLTLRHGNRCYVYGNFFFANKAVNSGGVRIIGEDHKVYNNYIENTQGESMKSGITFVNGIPGSALNEYYQVKRAVVCFNTLIGNRLSIHIGAGKSSTQSLPPLDCTVSNNLIYGTTSPLVTFTDNPVNMLWKRNIFYGANTGFSTLPADNQVINPNLSGADSSGIKHILSNSPAINNGMTIYSFITKDLDGQQRDSLPDIGSDEYSNNPRIIWPVNSKNTGPGTEIPTSIIENKPKEKSFNLKQNFPNPFNPNTTINYSIIKPGIVSLAIYDIPGNKIVTLLNEFQNSGEYSINWKPYNLSSGSYFYELSCNGQTETGKMLLLK